jgi:hypothetical protein
VAVTVLGNVPVLEGAVQLVDDVDQGGREDLQMN